MNRKRAAAEARSTGGLILGARVNLKNLFACSDLGREDKEMMMPDPARSLHWVNMIVRCSVDRGPMHTNMRLLGILKRGFPAIRDRLDGATYRFELHGDPDAEDPEKRSPFLYTLRLEFPSDRTDPGGQVIDWLVIEEDGRWREGSTVRAPVDPNADDIPF